MRLPGPPCASDLSGSPSGTRPHLRICPMPYPPGGHYQRRSQGTSRWTSASDTRKLGHPRCDRTPRCESDPFPPARSRGVQRDPWGPRSQNRRRPSGWELESQIRGHWHPRWMVPKSGICIFYLSSVRRGHKVHKIPILLGLESSDRAVRTDP